MYSFQKILGLAGDGILCTAAIILNGKKEVLLGLRHYQKKEGGKLIANPLWTTPGGRTVDGETVADCLVRESLEEVGIIVTAQEYWGEIIGAQETDTLHVFLCSYSDKPENKEPHKFEKWDWFARDDIPKNFINPQLHKILQEKL